MAENKDEIITRGPWIALKTAPNLRAELSVRAGIEIEEASGLNVMMLQVATVKDGKMVGIMDSVDVLAAIQNYEKKYGVNIRQGY